MFQKFRLSVYGITTNKWIERLAVGLAGVFAVSSIQRFWVHPSGGHTHRQSDTIGMSIAFAEQVHERGLAALDFLFYPRVLQSGLLDGINASEFPLLNVAGGVSFLFSSNPWVGVFLTSLMVLILNLYTAYIYLPKFLRAWNVELNGTIGLLLWFAGGYISRSVKRHYARRDRVSSCGRWPCPISRITKLLIQIRARSVALQPWYCHKAHYGHRPWGGSSFAHIY